MATRMKSHPKSMRCPFCGKWFKSSHTKFDCPAKLGENKNYRIKYKSRRKKRGFFKGNENN